MQADPSALAGKRIAVTRARHQAPPLAALIREFGGIPIAYPCIAIISAADPRPLDSALMRLDDFDWLALTSGNAAYALAARLSDLGQAVDWSRLKIAAVGAATGAEAQRHLGREADFLPAVFSAAEMARQLPLAPGARILLPQSNRAASAAADILRARGAHVTACSAYRTVRGRGGADLPRLLARGRLAALSFTSPSSVYFFRQRCPAPAALELPAACIGPVTAAAARRQGFRIVLCPPRARLRFMLSALAQGLRDTSDA